ncbi:mitochondrial dicarboxylate/tricarboxylate transporter DTC-like [Primulina eburnea]|uniref:mitochondrial dicarboxylate/tricarboxylate transporter DTC-like n=1 Tax=Primulina eburnea TaxID=1245227 RepID=UPI003C6C76C1
MRALAPFTRILTNKALEANDGKPLPLHQKASCGLIAGAIGATVGSPVDLALIYMQADATFPAAQRRNYTNAFHALYRIYADEGVLALWKGAGPTVVRAMALNMGMLASYDQSVEFFKDSLGFNEAATVFGASTVSGFFAAACSNCSACHDDMDIPEPNPEIPEVCRIVTQSRHACSSEWCFDPNNVLTCCID